MGTKALYKVIHTNKFGTDVYMVKSARHPSEEQVIKAAGIEFDDEDFIEIERVTRVYTVREVKRR